MPRTNKERLQDNNIELQNIKTGIDKLPTHLDTNDATALASNIVKDKTAYIKGKKIYGTLDFNVEQVVAGTDEIKKIYERVPNEVDLTSGTSSMTFVTNTNCITDCCSYTDPIFPYIIAFGDKDNKSIIKVYDKLSYTLVQELNLQDDLSLTSQISSYDIMLQGFVQNGNTYIFCGTGSDTRPCALYKLENGSFVFKDGKSLKLYAATAAYNYKTGYIYPGRGGGYAFKIVNDQLELVSLSNYYCSEYTNPWTSKMFCRDEYVIFANYYGSSYKSVVHKISVNSPNMAECELSKVGITDYYNGYVLVCLPNYYNIDVYYVGENLDNYTYTNIRIAMGNQAADVVRFLSTEYVMTISTSGVLDIYKLDYDNKNASKSFTANLGTRGNSLIIKWVTNTKILLHKSRGSYYILDYSDGIFKFMYAEDNVGNRFFSYDNGATLDNVGNVLEGSGIFVYKDGIGKGTMPNNGALNYTPAISQQTIPAGYTSGGTIAAVTSAIDQNIQAENIKKDITVLRSYWNIRK